MTLRIAPGLTLPPEAVTETFAILAKRGKGKTNTAVVMAEEMIQDGYPVVAIDPIGVWWGLRSSASGTKDGLPVVIFGGDHGDVPLEEGAGEAIADVLIDQRFPAVIDLSLLTKAAAKRFMTKFIGRIYHRNRDALHIIIDEADMFAPQRAQEDGKQLLGAMEDLVRRGRARGVGVTLITQRPAVLHKDVLTQAEVLIALGMTGPRDVAAIDEWVRLHAEEDQARELKASLPSLPVGTAWVWSPGFLNLLKKVQVRQRQTFDSSATPKPGQQRRTPKARAEIDLEALGEQISTTIEKARAQDPKVLQRRIRELERELEAERARLVPDPVVEHIEVPVLDSGIVDKLEALLEPASALLGETQETLLKHRMWAERQLQERPVERRLKPVRETPSPPQFRDAPKPRVNGRAPKLEDDVRLGKTERNILSVLAQHGSCTHSQLALLSGYSPKASTIGVALSKLRKLGFVEPGQPITATSEGVAWLGDDYEPLPTGGELIDYWRSKFGLTEQRVLDVLIDVYPNQASQTEVAERTGYSPTASTIGVALSKLRKVGVVTGWQLSEDLAQEAGL